MVLDLKVGWNWYRHVTDKCCFPKIQNNIIYVQNKNISVYKYIGMTVVSPWCFFFSIIILTMSYPRIAKPLRGLYIIIICVSLSFC